MSSSDFVSSSGLLRVLEKKLISNETVQKISDASSLEDAYRIIGQGSDYDFSTLSYAEDFEPALVTELKRVYNFGFKIDSKVTRILSLKYDFNNLKVAIKAHLLNIKETELDTITDSGYFKNLFLEKGDIEAVPSYILETFNEAMAAYEIKKDPQDISILIDKKMFDEMLKQAEETNSELIINYVKSMIDIFNIKSLIRCSNLKKNFGFLSNVLIEGGKIPTKEISDFFSKPFDFIVSKLFYKYLGYEIKSGMEYYQNNNNLSFLEKLLDDYLIRELKKAKMIPYGPELIFSYVANKENEIRQLRILFTGIMNEIPPEKLKERLRDNYA